jgi:retinol-binding protein 3
VNPVTGTNWEGVGVQPDIECHADSALDLAQLEAVKTLRDKEPDPRRKAMLAWQMDGLNARLHPVQLASDDLKIYAGTYGPRTVTLENGALFYQREQNPKRRLIPMGNHLFSVEGVDYFRVEFTPGTSGGITELIGHYDNGQTDRNPRSY